MTRWLALITLLWTVEAQAQTVHPEKLREAVCVPRPPFNFRYGMQLETRAKKPSLRAALARAEANPGDAESQMALAEAYGHEQDKQAAVYRRVVELLEKRVQDKDCSGWELALFGQALVELDRLEEGTVFCQQAVAAAPKDFRSWRALLHSQRKRALLALGKNGAFSADWKVGAAGVQASSKGITPEQADKAAKHVALVLEHLETMRRLAPLTEANVLERLEILIENRIMASVCDVVRNQLDPQKAGQFMLHPAVVEELALLGQTRQADFWCFAMAVTIQRALFQLENGGADAPPTKQQKDRFVAILAPVSRIIEATDKEIAWNAAMTVGVLLEETVDRTNAEFFYRKALGIDPQRPEAAENLAFCLFRQGKTKEAAQLLEDWQQRVPSLRCGLLLAHVLLEQRQSDQAEAIIQTLAKKHDAEAECQLALAAFCLRRSADAQQLAQAGHHLACAEKRLRSKGDGVRSKAATGNGGSEEQDKTGPERKRGIEFNGRDPEHWRKQLRLLTAVHLGLTGQPLQSWLELQTLRSSSVLAPQVEAALKAFD